MGLVGAVTAAVHVPVGNGAEAVLVPESPLSTTLKAFDQLKTTSAGLPLTFV